MSHCPTSKTTPISGYSAAFRRLVASFVLCLGLLGAAHGQNSRYDGIVWSRNGFPSPGASIDVCSQPISTSITPPYCTPLANLCSSATDAVCTSPNPVTADSMGNFHFYVKPGEYSLESYNSSLSPFLQADQVLSCPPGISCSLGAGTFTTLTSATANPAQTGQIRMAPSDCIEFRNNAHGADIPVVCLSAGDLPALGAGPFLIPNASDTAVGKATTDTLTNKTLNGATLQGNGLVNAVSLLNTQGPASPIVGTGADATMFTYSMPANVWAANKCITVDVGWAHTTGSASVSYKLKFGATTIHNPAFADTNIGSFAEYKVCNLAQNSQYFKVFALQGAATAIAFAAFGTSAVDFSQAQTISFTMSVANTDQVTPKFWKVSLDQ